VGAKRGLGHRRHHQYDSDGIFVQQVYAPAEHSAPTAPCRDTSTRPGNTRHVVDGEYDWANDCSVSESPPASAHHRQATRFRPPSVSGCRYRTTPSGMPMPSMAAPSPQLDSWSAGPEPHRWPLSDNMIIQHNSLSDIDGPRALPICGTSRPRPASLSPTRRSRGVPCSTPIPARTLRYRSARAASTP